MDQELLEISQNIKAFKCYRVYSVIGKGFVGKKYTRKGDAISGRNQGTKQYVLVCVNSVTGTTYEWI